MWVVFDIAIGLITIFLLFSIVVSGVNEWFAQIFARRGYYLRLGLQRLINDDTVYNRILHHPLIGSLYQERAAKGKPPSYIAPENFAMAIADVLLMRARVPKAEGDDRFGPQLTVEALRSSLQSPALMGSPIADALRPIIDRAGNNLELALQGIQSWFNAAMDRVSGWYKTRTHKMLFVVGLAVAALCNVDAIEIATTLNQSPALRGSLFDIAKSAATTGKVGSVDVGELKTRPPTTAEWESLRPVFESLRSNDTNGLPIGYACLGVALRAEHADTPWNTCVKEIGRTWREKSVTDGIFKFLGWALTAFAGTLGAGYWFGWLVKAINIRGSGPKPVAPVQVTTVKAS